MNRPGLRRPGTGRGWRCWRRACRARFPVPPVRPYRVGQGSIVDEYEPILVYFKYARVSFFMLYIRENTEFTTGNFPMSKIIFRSYKNWQ